MSPRCGWGRWWLTSPLFRSYLASFLLLWIGAKVAIVRGAMLAGLDPYAFEPRAETWGCILELLVLAHFIRRRGEDVLLGNLGMGLGDALLPLVLAHTILSAAVALIAP